MDERQVNERGTGPETTRREFLVALAKASTYVAPLVLTLRGTPLSAGGKGANTTTVFGGLSPAASMQSSETPTFQLQESTGSSTAPWSQPPPQAPWSQPPASRDEE